jgi:hypothetical protein
MQRPGVVFVAIGDGLRRQSNVHNGKQNTIICASNITNPVPPGVLRTTKADPKDAGGFRQLAASSRLLYFR